MYTLRFGIQINVTLFDHSSTGILPVTQKIHQISIGFQPETLHSQDGCATLGYATLYTD